jgi:hypothetical protein
MAVSPHRLELPRPAHLLRTVGWNFAESFGLPLAGYGCASWLWGRDAGVFVMLGAVWVTAIIRKLATGAVPGLVTISVIVLTVQAVVAIATGNLWIFLVHFPLANLALCVVFARSARGHTPLAARLAAEVIGLRMTALSLGLLHRFFQRVTMLWAGVFLLLAASLGALLAIVPAVTYVPVWAVITIALIAAGVGVCVVWLRLELRKQGIGLCFVPADGA